MNPRDSIAKIKKLNEMKSSLAEKVEDYNKLMGVGKKISFQLSKEYHSRPTNQKRIEDLQANLQEFNSEEQKAKRGEMHQEILGIKKSIIALEKEIDGKSDAESDSVTLLAKRH